MTTPTIPREDDMTDDVTIPMPTATDRVCTICKARVAAWPQVMVCHCYEMPWPVDAALTTAARDKPVVGEGELMPCPFEAVFREGFTLGNIAGGGQAHATTIDRAWANSYTRAAETRATEPNEVEGVARAICYQIYGPWDSIQFGYRERDKCRRAAIAALATRHASSGGTVADAALTAPRLGNEVSEEMIEQAYREGFVDGNGRLPCEQDDLWQASGTRAMLAVSHTVKG